MTEEEEALRRHTPCGVRLSNIEEAVDLLKFGLRCDWPLRPTPTVDYVDSLPAAGL